MDTKKIKSFPTRLPFYYGWINLAIAALAMVATLPARTFGLGLITEPLLHNLAIDRVFYGKMNFWATMIGSTFALVCGPAVDRFGVRTISTSVLFCLGVTVLVFSSVTGAAMLIVLLILVRGFGQSALSAVSLTIVGKWFVQRLSKAMGIFSVIIGIGFVAAIVIVETSVLQTGWRNTWFMIGWSLIAVSVLGWLLVRRSPESCGLEPDQAINREDETPDKNTMPGFSLSGALKTMAFWVFAIGSALYNLIIAGVLLFNQSILQELGFDEIVFRNAMAGFVLVGLAGNLLAGWLAQKWSLGKLMAVAMISLTLCLATYPILDTEWKVILHAMMLGLSGGVVTVVFFTSFGKLFGRPHLGKIQGVAQVLAVLASACGPWLLAEVYTRTGSYNPAFFGFVPVVVVISILALVMRIPKPESAKS